MTEPHESVPVPLVGRVAIPTGWTLRPLSGPPGLYLIETPGRLMATIDFDRRTVRSGMSYSGPTLGGGGDFKGRSWRQRIVALAVAHLVEVGR